ncbi:MAG: toast rack family protein [Bacillus sp. (in: Bacteria)]|nr:toast rack family protein [Bacillus sp. (in: firmicutes)]
MALITMFVFLAGCSSLNPVSATIGNDITQEVTIEKDNAESLDVTIDFSVGNLMVSGGAQSSDWMTGELLYNNKDFEAKAEYRLKKNRGEIILKQKNSGKWNSIVSDTKNQWDLELNNSVPTDLSIKAGVAESKLDLKGLHLTTLSVDAGVGSMEVDLSGDWLSSFKGEIKTGIGETTILLPKDVGVEITAKTGIGAVNFDGFISKGNNVYVNEAYDTADVVITITANTGIGETKFALK